MFKTTTYLLVLLYIIAMLKPVSPFIEYAINYDYISEVLCINKDKPEIKCNGQCYVMKQFEIQKQEDLKSLQINTKDYPIGFVKLFKIAIFKHIPLLKKQQYHYQQTYSFIAVNSIFHPPTV